MAEQKIKSPPLLVLRIIWGTVICAELAFAIIVTFFFWSQKNMQIDRTRAREFIIVAVAMMVILLPLAFVIRRIIYQRGPDGAIERATYATGNIVFYTVCAVVAFAGLIVMRLRGGPGEEIIVPAVAVALQIVNYPNGNALRPPSKNLPWDG